MGDIHSQMVGDELHIARTFVSTGDPNGVVTPGIIGEFYWDSTNNKLYVAESLLNDSWVTTTGAFDTFIELTDTPSDYAGNAGFVTQVNVAEDGLEFGQALRAIDSPFFNALTIQPVSGDANLFINNSGGTEKLKIQFDAIADEIDIFSSFPITLASGSELFINGNPVSIAAGTSFSVNANNIFVDISTGFVGFGSVTPLAQIFVSSLLSDTIPVSMQESLGTNGARIKTRVGTQNPEGLITGEPGDHYWRVNGVDSTLFIKRSAGSSNTDWDTVFGTGGGVTTPGVLTDNFLVRGDGLETIDIGNIFMSADGNDLTIPGTLELIPAEPTTRGLFGSGGLIGTASDVFVVNNYAYVVGPSSDSLAIIDITDPDTPEIIGSLVNSGELQDVTGIFVRGQYAYLVSPVNAAIVIVDVSDVSNPVLTGILGNPAIMNGARSITVMGKYAYIAASTSDSLAVVDVSDPFRPVEVGSVIDATNLNGAFAIHVLGKFAYIAASNSNRLTIVDISNPSAPVVVGSLQDNTNMAFPQDVYIVGRYAYVTGHSSDSLAIVDVSDPASPVLVGSVTDGTLLNLPFSVWVAGRYAYVTTISPPARVVVIDISDPTAPAIIQSFVTIFSTFVSIFVSGKYAYVVDSANSAFAVIDLAGIDASTASIGNVKAGYLSVDTDAAVKGLLNTGGLNVGIRGIHSDGNMSARGALDLVPSTPNLAGSLTDSINIDTPVDLYIVNNYAYVLSSGSSDSISILDITDPRAPVLVGSLLDAVNLSFPRHVVVAGKYAYISSSLNNSLVIVDVSNVFAPVFVSSLVDALAMGGASAVYLAGKFCYVLGTDSNSIAVVDISDPNNPAKAGSLVDGTNLIAPEEMYVLGKYAYVTLQSSRLKIIDISNPITPVIVGDLDLIGAATGPSDIYVVGGFAYITGRLSNSMAVIDVRNPALPVQVGEIKDPTKLEAPESVSIDGNFAYVTTGGSLDAIVVIDIADPNTDPVITNSFPAGIGAFGSMEVSGKFAYVLLPATDTFAVIDIHGIEASTASLGNVKAGYLSVDNEAVIKGDLSADGINSGPHGIHSDGDISGSTSFSTFDKGDNVAIGGLKNTGLNPGVSQTRVGNRNPLAFVTGRGGDVYFRGNGDLSGSYESKELVAGENWFKRSVNPFNIIEINTEAEFEELATAGVITISTNTTINSKVDVRTATRFVLSGGASLNFNSPNRGPTLAFEGNAVTFISGTGTFRSTNMTFSSINPPAVFMDITGGIVDLDRVVLENWDDLGTFNDGVFLLRCSNAASCGNGFNLVNPTIVSVDEFGHTGTPMAGNSLFRVNSNNPNSSMVFSKVGSITDEAVFDFSTLLVNAVPIVVGGSFVSAGLGGTIFKKTSVATVAITGVLDASPATGTITLMADNGSGGTTISSITTYFENEKATLSGTTNYNDEFQIFNVVPGVSFDIRRAFVGDESPGSIDSERIDIGIASAVVGVGDSNKLTGTNFYNAFYTVLDLPAALIITVNGTFISTNTSGTIEIGVSLDETDPRLNAKSNSTIADSNFLASAFVNDNGTNNGAMSNGVFIDMVFGTVGAALIASSTMERWRLVDEINGSFENINLEPFNGFLDFDFTVKSTGGTVDFFFKWQIDRGAGFVDLPDPVEVLVNVGGDSQNVSKAFPLVSNLGDIIKPQIARDSGSSSITTSYATINTSD